MLDIVGSILRSGINHWAWFGRWATENDWPIHTGD